MKNEYFCFRNEHFILTNIIVLQPLIGYIQMNSKIDPMGRAIADYYKNNKADKLRVFSPMFDEDEIPLHILFRTYNSMPEIEKKAINLVTGKTLDVGAAAGCHSLILQNRGIDVTATDISPLSVDTMILRGIKNVLNQDFFTMDGQYDTILMLMNGIGIVGTLDRMTVFFRLLNKILSEKGQVLCDSSDISYIFEDKNGIIKYPDNDRYYGEVSFQMKYKNTVGEPFNWLYIDSNTLKRVAEENGFYVEVIAEGKHYDYLARITKQ